MERYLITHSLLSAWLYGMKENPNADATNEPKDPMAGFLQVLRRESTPTTSAMQDGINFEDLVTSVLTGQKTITFPEIDYKTEAVKVFAGRPSDHRWFGAAEKVARIVNGGLLQYRAKKEIEVGGMKFVLYGRLDCLKAGTITDIKFSSSYDRGKYITSTQHPVYMELIPEAQKFTYIISNGTEVWTETYDRAETPDIRPIISNFLDWLYTVGLMQTYQEKWEAK